MAVGLENDKLQNYYIDESKDDWDIEWCTVVAISMPNGPQVSWHMGPETGLLAQKYLPNVKISWDGTYLSRSPAVLDIFGSIVPLE